MLANKHYTRLNLLELKGLIYQKIGHQRADKYFDQLQRLFSLQISKGEFDKFCVRAIGRENISLHNRLIKSIIKNACLAKVPPLKVRKAEGCVNDIRVANGYQRSCLHSLHGDAFPPSPRKTRSPVNRERKFRDRPSPLGPLGKSPSLTCEEGITKPQQQLSATELHSLGSRPPVEVLSVEDGEEVEQFAASPSVQSRSPVTAPLGVSMNVGNARKVLSSGFYNFNTKTCENSGELPDTRTLRSRLEPILEMEGLTISTDCANLLNNALDVYLKRLIEPCIGLAGSRFHKQHLEHQNGPKIHGLNGMLPGIHAQRPIRSVRAYALDFCVAMESSPAILGEDWPIKLEKMRAHSLEECTIPRYL